MYSRSAGQQGPELRALDICPACPCHAQWAWSGSVVVVPLLGWKVNQKAATPLTWFTGVLHLGIKKQNLASASPRYHSWYLGFLSDILVSS